MSKPTKADRLSAVRAHYGNVSHGSSDVPGYLWSWVDTGYGHGLPDAAREIFEIRMRTTRLCYCEALEVLGGDGHSFIHGDGKALPLSAVIEAIRSHVAWREEVARDDARRSG